MSTRRHDFCLSQHGGTPPAYHHSIIHLPAPFYIRIEAGPNFESAMLCVNDGEPDVREIAKFHSIELAQAYGGKVNLSAGQRDDAQRAAVKHAENIGFLCGVGIGSMLGMIIAGGIFRLSGLI